jgi:hypothetical protein
VTTPNDPEDVTELQPADLAEVAVDETPDELRPLPLEADPADTAEQRVEVDLEDPVDPDDDI